MIEEITKNVTTTMNILANIGILFLILVALHLIGPNAYFTPHAIREVPLLILGFGVGYLGWKLYMTYYKK